MILSIGAKNPHDLIKDGLQPAFCVDTSSSGININEEGNVITSVAVQGKLYSNEYFIFSKSFKS